MPWKYWVLWLAYRLLGRFSLKTLYGIANLVGTGAFVFRHSARAAVMANMRQVMGPDASRAEVRRTSLEVFRNATRYYADLLHAPRLDIKRFRAEQVELEGVDYLTDAQESGRGAVIVSAHFGSPELAVQALAAEGFSFFGLTEPLRPRQLSEFTHRLRSKHGHEYRTVSFGGIKEAVQRLRSGGLVAVLMDRDVAGTGVPMQFCGRETRIPTGAVDLALRTNSDVIPAWAWRIDGYRFQTRIGPPLELIRTGDAKRDVLTNTQRLLALFEGHLRAYPGQWAVLEAIWDDEPEPTPSGAIQ